MEVPTDFMVRWPIQTPHIVCRLPRPRGNSMMRYEMDGLPTPIGPGGLWHQQHVKQTAYGTLTKPVRFCLLFLRMQ
eukprot:c39593_g1_i1 orf=136-363(+)